MKTLENSKVVILGASSGLGFATAKAAAAEGAQLVIVSSSRERIDKALQDLPGDTEGYIADLSREENIRDLFAKIGTFDHLVYTAGENLNLTNLSETDLEKTKDFFTLRYWGALAAIKYGSPNINEGGSINLTSGTASQRPGAGWALASSICGAVEGLCRAMAVELAPIRVNAVAPGVIRTNLWNGMTEEQRTEFYKNIGDSLLVKRVGESDEIAQAFIYLMRQSFTTGQILTVDGGTVLV